MILRCVGSNSKGNAYVMIAENEILLLEAGCKLIEVKKSINWKISKVVGCLVSHAHQDHAGYITDYMKNGIPVYGGYGTQIDIEERGGERIKVLQSKEKTQIGGFSVQPFELEHDCPCYGFLISHMEMGRLVFATDTEYVKPKFKNLNHIMIEANYSKQYLDENNESQEKRKHVMYGHVSIEAAVNFVRENRSSSLYNVVLIHLSDRNGDPAEFQKQIQEVVDCDVTVAKHGIEVKLKPFPF